MTAKLKAAAQRIAASFLRAFIASMALGNIANINNIRGVTTLVYSAIVAGGAAALRALEAMLKTDDE